MICHEAVLVVSGVREYSGRKILGARITDCENEEFWLGFFEDLKERGLAGVQRSSRMGIPASRRWLKPLSSARPSRCVRSTVPGWY
jgi:hypothetical protein